MNKKPEKRKTFLESDKSSLNQTSNTASTSIAHNKQILGINLPKRNSITPDEFLNKDIDRINSVTPKPVRHNSSKFIGILADDLKPLPLLRDAPVGDRERLLIEKLRLCCQLFDFTIPTSCIKSKEVKRQTLSEIADYIIMNTHCLTTENVYEELIRMVKTNSFRPLPPPSGRSDSVGPPETEDDEINLEPSWPHLQAVYEVFLRFLSTPEYQAAICKKFMDHHFILGLLELFDSEDPRERDYLKTILHRIYGKLVNLRPFIRKQITHIFLRFIYENERHNGIAELLEILASIINGFQVPLKEEHKVFLRYILLPLHKAHSLHVFQTQLAYCVTEFIKKDSSLLQTCFVDGFFKFWPKVDTQKEILFLNELEECLECADSSDLQAICKPLFQRIAQCVSSNHFQVAERTLYFWSNDRFILILANYVELGMSILLPALQELKFHWNKNLRPLVNNVLKIMEDLNQNLFNQYSQKAKESKKLKCEQDKRKSAFWNSIEKAAKLNEALLCKSARQTIKVAYRNPVNSAPVSKSSSLEESILNNPTSILSGSFNWLSKYGLGSNSPSTSSLINSPNNSISSKPISETLTSTASNNVPSITNPRTSAPGGTLSSLLSSSLTNKRSSAASVSITPSPKIPSEKRTSLTNTTMKGNTSSLTLRPQAANPSGDTSSNIKKIL